MLGCVAKTLHMGACVATCDDLESPLLMVWSFLPKRRCSKQCLGVEAKVQVLQAWVEDSRSGATGLTIQKYHPNYKQATSSINSKARQPLVA